MPLLRPRPRLDTKRPRPATGRPAAASERRSFSPAVGELQDDPDLRHFRSRSAAATHRLGRTLGQALKGGEVLALDGELGSGKTTLLRGLADGLGVPPEAVSSPTFVLIHEYRGRRRLVHADLYRLTEKAGCEALGLADYFDGRSVVAVEWAAHAGGDLPADRLDIHLGHVAPTAREIVLRATGIRSRACLARAFPSLSRRRPPRTAPRKGRRR